MVAAGWAIGSAFVAVVLSIVGSVLAQGPTPTPTPTPTPVPVPPPAPDLSGAGGGFYASVFGLGVLCAFTGVGILPLVVVMVLQLGGMGWGSVWVGYAVLGVAVVRKYILR